MASIEPIYREIAGKITNASQSIEKDCQSGASRNSARTTQYR